MGSPKRRSRSRRVAVAVVRSVKILKETGRRAAKFASENPIITASLVTGLVMAVAPGLVAGPVLDAFGFSAHGVAAGSAAAAAQAEIGNVLAGSFFATLQSAAADGPAALLIHGAVKVAGLAIAAIATWFAKW